MKIGPDGSLCRITSSAKDLYNNVRIVKVPDSELSYKIQIIRPTDEHEQLSEKSSDEMSDDEFFDIKVPSKNSEKENVETKVDKPHEPEHETVSEGDKRDQDRSHRSRPYQYNKKNRYGQRNNFNKNSKNYKSRTNVGKMYNYGNRDLNSAISQDYSSTSNRDFSTPVNRDFSPSAAQDFNSSVNRDFTFAANRHVAFNTDNYQHTSGEFSPSPWLEPPVMHPFAPFSHAQPENKRNSVGLLGDRPLYAPSVSNLQNKYNHDQTLPYPPAASNNRNNSFVHKQNYWKNNYGNYNKNKRNWNSTSRSHQKERGGLPRNNNYRK